MRAFGIRPSVGPIARDLRWAARHLARRPVFGLAVAATLAMSIAAATIAFGLATAVLWRPLPFRDADRLVFVWESTERDGQPGAARVTSTRFAAWRDHARSFDRMALFAAATFTIGDADGTTSLRGVRVSPSFFDTLGVTPLLGRGFESADQEPGRAQVVVLSHALWQQRFGGRATVVGETVRLSGLPFTIVGVMPPLTFPGWPVNPASVTVDPAFRELWVPIVRTPALDQNAQNARAHVYGVVARLAPGATRDTATQELNGLRSAGADPHGAQLAPLREQFVRDARLPLLALMGAAFAVLLVACANLAALHVSDFESRRAELSVRTALGATARLLAQQLILESLVLAITGGLAGIVLARVALTALPGLLPPTVPLVTPADLDVRVALFAMAIAITAGLLLAAWPIGRLLWLGPASQGALRQAPGRAGVYRSLIVVQVSLAIAMIAAAALLTRSLWSVRGRDPGFVLNNVLVAEVGLPAGRYDTPDKTVAMEDRLRDSLEARRGMLGVALAYDHPLESNWTDTYTWVGDTAAAGSGQAHLRIVSPGYFDALGVQIVEGRTFTNQHGSASPGVAVVNEAFAREQGQPVVGRRLRSSAPQGTWGASLPAEFEVVGIVENERFRGLEETVQPAVYLSTRQFPQTTFALILRTGTDPRATFGEVRATIRELDADATVSRPTTLLDVLDEQLVARRVTTDVIGGFAGAALLLAVLGLYGLLAMRVASRRRELGVRLALGASPGGLAREIVLEGIRHAIVGSAGGLVLAFMTGHLLRGLLVGIGAGDPGTLALTVVTLIAAAALAAAIPAWRASRIDPAIALRD